MTAGAAGGGELARARQVAGSVPDPELPMLTVADLGILAGVSLEGGLVSVALTPTYSGCPAMTEMAREVAARLAAAGFPGAQVRTQLSPPWSSDMITAAGRAKLAASGIAPPRQGAGGPAGAGPVPLRLLTAAPLVDCPACGSAATETVAAFGAAACRDLRRCRSCGEPFEHVKEI